MISLYGMGNILHSDDAFGPSVVRVFGSRFETPPGVEVVDLGTPGGDLVSHLADRDAVILVDTVRVDAPAGTLRRYDGQQLLRHAPQPRVNAHDPGLKEALLLLELEGRCPRDVVLIGVVPEVVAQGTRRSPAVEAAVSGAISLVLEEFERLGVPVTARSVARDPDLWWEAPPAHAAAPRAG